MKVNHVTERNEQGQQAPSFLDSEELDKRGITLNTTGRLQLMAKLAEGKITSRPGIGGIQGVRHANLPWKFFKRPPK